MIRPVLFTFLSRASAAVLNFGTMVLLSRYLGAEGKGLASKLMVLIAGIQIIADFSGGAAMVFLSSRHRLKSLLLPAWSWAVMCSIIAALVLIQTENGNVFGWHLALLAFLCSTLNQHIHLLNGRSAFQEGNILTFLQALFIFGSVFLLFQKTAEISAYIHALYIGWGLPWLISLWMLYRLPESNIDGAGRLSGFKHLLRYGSANQTGHLVQYLTQRIAFYLLPAFSLGVYSNAITLSEALWMFASAVAVVQYGTISNSQNKDYAAQLSLVLMKLVFVLTALGGLFLVLIPQTVYIRLFGNEFGGIVQVLPLLYPGICMMSVYLIAGHYFSGLGKFRQNNYALLSGLLVSIVSYGLIYIYDYQITLQTVAFITTLANGAIFFSVLWLFSMHTRLRFKDFMFSRNDIQQFQALLLRKKAEL